ncbi:MAG: hypothetical protein R3F59_04155 [Myxococcota bacterium]
MSEFHYVRTRGADGGVDACEGPAIGLDLETVLDDGLPPWNIALEIVAALCEILDIADEDGEVHGEVHPRHVFIDETGAVSLEGFGIKRPQSRAPEGAVDTRADLYGLGYTAFRCFCSRPLPEPVPGEGEAHDEMVIDAALAIDLSGVPPAMQGDIQWYVAKLMEFDAAQRPTALEAWRTFVAFANGWEGIDMAEWCAAALDGGGARRTETDGAASAEPAVPRRVAAPAPPPRGAVEEPTRPTPAAEEPTRPAPPVPVSPGSLSDDDELEGLVVHKGPLQSQLNFDEPPSGASQSATGFWTREDMRKALANAPEHVDEALPPPVATPVELTADGRTDGGRTTGGRPPSGAGGGQATSFWSAQQLQAMERGDENALRPRRAEGEGERRRVTAAQRPPAPRSYAGPRTLATGRSGPATGRLPPAQRPEPPSSSERTVPAATIGQAAPTVLQEAPAPAPRSRRRRCARPSPSRARAAAAARGGGDGSAWCCSGAGSPRWWRWWRRSSCCCSSWWSSCSPGRAAIRRRRGSRSRGPCRARRRRRQGRPRPIPARTGASWRRRRRRRLRLRRRRRRRRRHPGRGRRGRRSPRRASPRRARVRALPAPGGGPAKVTLRSSGSGAISGCSPSRTDFVKVASFSIEAYLLPATCLVTIEGAKGVFRSRARAR